jgi:hypothetical protein
MANPEHLAILQQGVEAWNKWRRENSRVEVDLNGATLRGANLTEANLSGADLSKANLSRTNLSKADLNGANLSKAHLTLADLSAAHLIRAQLGGANLFGAHLSGANLIWANLSEADLRSASLERVHFSEANLEGVAFDNASLWDTTFANVDLSKVRHLETVKHLGPSSIGIDTIYQSKGNIPEVFLRGAGVPEDFIVYMRSLAAHPIEFYSCFISYSSKDDDFARRLHADLQQNGVRCWFAPEDLKIGDKFRTRIDESIRLYDKLIVILTENSIRSSWVEEEVEAALEKERRQSGKLVLFPICLDDAVWDTDQAWAASLRRTRHIGDFRHWKDHDAFRQALERLLRDLKSGG